MYLTQTRPTRALCLEHRGEVASLRLGIRGLSVQWLIAAAERVGVGDARLVQPDALAPQHRALDAWVCAVELLWRSQHAHYQPCNP